MFRNIFRSLEDPKRHLLGPNYWIMKKIGLLLPNNKTGKILYIMIHAIVAFFVLTQYIELYVIRSDLDLVLTNLKISMLSIVCIVKAITVLFWQDSWQEVIKYVTQTDKFERENRNTTRGKILDKYTKYCRWVTYFFWSLVFMTFVTVVFTPLLRYVSSESYRESIRNGTELFTHIFSSWVPFDKYNPPGVWITIIWHTACCFYGACIMAAYDSCIIVIMVFFGGKLELFRERCKQISGNSRIDTNNEGAAGITIQELHHMHILLLKYSRLFNSLLSPVMFFYMVICSIMICASAFQLVNATNTGQKIMNAEYLIFGVAQLFMFCWHSNDVLGKSYDAMLGPYESAWWAASLRDSKNILTFAGQLRLVQIYSAGPFTDLTLSTFITILKGAYSYYTLLRK